MAVKTGRSPSGMARAALSRYHWHRTARRLKGTRVLGGPFEGMLLGANTTGSHLPKLLGSYEAELHPVLDVMRPYERVIDVGCGEGWYVVGLALRWPTAEVFGFDSSEVAQDACRANARLNGVTVTVGGELDPDQLAALLRPNTLLIVDIEGAEADLLEGPVLRALDSVDVLVETHDFTVPGVTLAVQSRLAGRENEVLEQQRRDAGQYPALARLTAPQARRALEESRPVAQSWIWSPAFP